MLGIGGGGFMMVYDGKIKDIMIIDSCECVLVGVIFDMFFDENGKVIFFFECVIKGIVVGVSGMLKGLEEVLDKWGICLMKKLIVFFIKFVEKGFLIDLVLVDVILNYQEKLLWIVVKDVFLLNGELFKEGDILI